MTVLVTGATGFIGRNLMKPEYRAFVRAPAGFENEVVGDLTDEYSVEIACKNVETIFHCAGYAVDSEVSKKHHEVNYQGTKTLINAAARAGVKRFVFLSSVKAMAAPGSICVDENWSGLPTSEYGLAKRAAEEEVLELGRRFGMHVVNLRLAMVYGRGGGGNLARLARGLTKWWFPLLPDICNRRSLVHVNDVVSAVLLVAKRPEANGKTYIVADSETYSGRELCEAICCVLEQTRISWSIPVSLLRCAGIAGDVISGIIQRRVVINSDLVSRLLDSECYSPKRIERELGWRALVSLEDGVREMLSSLKENR